MAKLIQIIRRGSDVRLVIDGEQILRDTVLRNAVIVPVHPDDKPTVTLTLVAEQVEVINTAKDNT